MFDAHDDRKLDLVRNDVKLRYFTRMLAHPKQRKTNIHVRDSSDHLQDAYKSYLGAARGSYTSNAKVRDRDASVCIFRFRIWSTLFKNNQNY